MPLTNLALMSLLLAAPGDGPPRRHALDEVPPALADAVKRADAAAQTLQRKLSARLIEAMKAGGPLAAVTVCRDEAAKLTREAERDAGAAVGRTSDRLRNPRNAAPPWAAGEVAAAAGKRAADVRPAVYDLGDRVGLLRPIAVAQPCTTCHGTAGAIPPQVSKSLAEAYPGDRATGYADGEHRGFVWAVVRR